MIWFFMQIFDSGFCSILYEIVRPPVGDGARSHQPADLYRALQVPDRPGTEFLGNRPPNQPST
jgi:hypothetical protein